MDDHGAKSRQSASVDARAREVPHVPSAWCIKSRVHQQYEGKRCCAMQPPAYMIEEETEILPRFSIHWWVERLGHVPLADLDSDDSGAYSTPTRRPSTEVQARLRVCRRSAPLQWHRQPPALGPGGLLKWAKRRRLTPKRWTNPVRDTEQRREAPHRVSFLSEDERRAFLLARRFPAMRGSTYLFTSRPRWSTRADMNWTSSGDWPSCR